MDRSEFDGIVRLFGAAATRRAGLRALAAGFLGGGALAEAGPRAEAKPETGDDADIEGICGKGKKNKCRKHKDCCTGYCQKKKGKGGRCRCIKKGRRCRKGQQCCKALACTEGRCRPKAQPAPTPAVCTDKMVCASGCTYPTVQAAIDALQNGATMQKVVIGAGEYIEDLTVTGKIELAACSGEAVVLRNATADATRARTILMPEPAGSDPAPELVLTDIIVTAKQPMDATYGGGGIMVHGKLTLNGSTTVKDCFADSYDSYGGGIHLGENAVLTMNGASSVKNNGTSYQSGGVHLDANSSLIMNDDASISGNSSDGDGGGVYANSTIVMNGRSSMAGNTALDGSYGGAVYLVEGATLTMNDDSTMSGNRADGAGSGGAVYADNLTEFNAITMNGNSRMLGNSAETGGAVYLNYASQITMNGASSMSGNTASQKGGALYMHCTAVASPPNAFANNNYTTLTLAASASITGNTAAEGGAVFGGTEFLVAAGGLPGKVIGGAGITGNTPSTDQCKGTDKPTCV